MTAELVRREQHGPVRLISLNRPERRNALGMDDRIALLELFREAEADESVRAIVLTGEGRVFCAGGNITGMTTDPAAGRAALDAMSEVAIAVTGSRLPVVAAVEGGAYGAGLSLAALCDVVIAADDAAFSAAFVKIGLTADTGATWALTRRIGWARTKRLLMTGEVLHATEALALDLVDEVVAAGTTRERALHVAAEFATRAPLSLAASKRLMNELPADLAGALASETATQLGLFASADFAEGRQAFADRRPPVFGGRSAP